MVREAEEQEINGALGSILLLTTEEEVTVDKPDTYNQPHDDLKDVESAPKTGVFFSYSPWPHAIVPIDLDHPNCNDDRNNGAAHPNKTMLLRPTREPANDPGQDEEHDGRSDPYANREPAWSPSCLLLHMLASDAKA